MNWNKNNVIVNTNQETQEVNVEEKSVVVRLAITLASMKLLRQKKTNHFWTILRSDSMDK